MWSWPASRRSLLRLLLTLSLVPAAVAGCGRSSLLGFDNGCPWDDPFCEARFADGSIPVDPDGGDPGDGFDPDGGDPGDGFDPDGGDPGDGFDPDGGDAGDGFDPDGDAGDGSVPDGAADAGGDAAADGPTDGASDGPVDGASDSGRDMAMCARLETCDNGRDDDCNGLVDCMDRACQMDPRCNVMKKEQCTNMIDDDANGFVDCQDPACFGDPACVVLGREVCNNGIDDNDNNLVDCKDPDCAGDPICNVNPFPEVCDNGRDDNGDNLIDCADPQCVAFPACIAAACQPEIDFGTLSPTGASVMRAMGTVGAARAYATCAPPGGTARVGRFTLSGAADVKVEFTQQAGGAHVVAFYRAGVNQNCDQNLLTCIKVGQAPSATQTLAGLAAGTYWVIVQSYPGTQGPTTVTLSTGRPNTPEICNNGRDDDGDGLVDCADLQCANAPNCANACKPDINLGALVVNGPPRMAVADTTTSSHRYRPTCAGQSEGKDIVVRFTLKETAGILLQWTQTGDHAFGLFVTPPAGRPCDATQTSCYYPGGRPGGSVAWQARPPGDYLFIFKPVKAGLEGRINIALSAFKNRQLEICSNNIDDDGNGLVDCDDPACFGVGNCRAPLCQPDVDLGEFDFGTQKNVMLDVVRGLDLYRTRCGMGNGKERVVRVTLLKPMALGFSCTQMGDHVLQLASQVNPLDLCDAAPMVCADPKILPFGCNFAIPNLQAGRYNIIVEGFQQGQEGVVDLTLFGIEERVLEVCNNGVDDDMDGFTDCADKKCVTQPECRPLACRADQQLGLLPIDGMVTSTVVQTNNAGNDQKMTPCAAAAGGQDSVVSFELPADTDLTIEWAQVGDHVFALYEDSNPLLACDANPMVHCAPSNGMAIGRTTLKKVRAGRYHLVVDATRPGREGGVVVQLSGVPSP